MEINGIKRRLPIGAEVDAGGGTSFRVWCPNSQSVTLLLQADKGSEVKQISLAKEEDAHFSALVPEAQHGFLYRYRLDDGNDYPDPASRFQPEGPHGPSQIIDPLRFQWTDDAWQGPSKEGQIIYEMHIGTFTTEGTWAAAEGQLGELEDLGVTVLEVMPVADFAGLRGWGYDGVNLFAPTRLYGEPDEFRSFVNAAHRHHLAVILDVVYNHLGPDGNHLKSFDPQFFSKRHTSEWGEALNFDGPGKEGAREHFIGNAGYWIKEFHLDGLRLDCTDQIFDDSAVSILSEITWEVREAAAPRNSFVVAENEGQKSKLIRAVEQGGNGMDAVWNDDFHHCAIVALTGKNEAYYTDYHGTPQELISVSKWGFLYQGQYYSWQKKCRGTPSMDLPLSSFVTFIQNHDQIANTLWGKRIHMLTSAGRLRAMTAFLLLGPGTPMLFQGQEFASSAFFLYFADHEPALAKAVAEGRAKFLSQFPSIASPKASAVLSDPNEESTYLQCKLDFSERTTHAQAYYLHQDLIQLRKSTPLFWQGRKGRYDGAVLGDRAMVLRFFGSDQDDRLLIVNLGRDFRMMIAPEPLLAPPEGLIWEVIWSSEDPRYGGGGTPLIAQSDQWNIPSEAAVVFAPQPYNSHERSPGKNN